MDGDKQCGVDCGYIWRRRYGERDSELFLYGEYGGILTDGDHHHCRGNIYLNTGTAIHKSSAFQRFSPRPDHDGACQPGYMEILLY